MATRTWIGSAARVKQITTLTVGGTVEIGDLFRCTIGNKTLQVAATSTSTSTTAAEIATAWNLSLNPEFAEITAVANGAVVTLTGDTSGVPFSVTATTVESNEAAADAQTFVAATPTAAAGPNFFDDADNYLENAVPVTGDDLYFLYGDADLLYNIAQSGILLASLNLSMRYTGRVGLPSRSAAGYDEYRQEIFEIGATAVNFGTEDGIGSSRVRLDTGAGATTLAVSNTGFSEEQGQAALEWRGTHAANIVRVSRGTVHIAVSPGELATVATLQLWKGATVRCGSGVTLTTVTKHDGVLYISSNTTSLENMAGECFVLAGAHTLITTSGGKVYYNSTGTLSAAETGTRGILDFSKDARAKTCANCNVYSGGSVLDPKRVVIFTNGVRLQHTRLQEVSLDLGTHVQISATLL